MASSTRENSTVNLPGKWRGFVEAIWRDWPTNGSSVGRLNTVRCSRLCSVDSRRPIKPWSFSDLNAFSRLGGPLAHDQGTGLRTARSEARPYRRERLARLDRKWSDPQSDQGCHLCENLSK
jgi:hypothetical protein